MWLVPPSFGLSIGKMSLEWSKLYFFFFQGRVIARFFFARSFCFFSLLHDGLIRQWHFDFALLCSGPNDGEGDKQPGVIYVARTFSISHTHTHIQSRRSHRLFKSPVDIRLSEKKRMCVCAEWIFALFGAFGRIDHHATSCESCGIFWGLEEDSKRANVDPTNE